MSETEKKKEAEAVEEQKSVVNKDAVPTGLKLTLKMTQRI